MASRLKLQSKLEELLGSRNVYYNPPENLKMEYDAIRYSRKNINVEYADDSAYSMFNCYELIVITRKPDSPVIGELLRLPMCVHNRYYVSDNLHHDVFTLYF